MKHEKLQIPDGDILVHTGDFSSLGRWDDIKCFVDWFASQPHQQNYDTGNHDLTLELPYYNSVVGISQRYS